MDNILNSTDTYIRKYLANLDTLLDDFVTDICINRDESHGRNHMWKISRLSYYIGTNEMVHFNLMKDILIVGWLHDIADHKYDIDNNLEKKLLDFLNKNFSDKSQYYFNIINRISYSKEVKNGTSDWQKLLGNDGIIVRNIVSDADKIDALGENGVIRCALYGKHKHKNESMKEIMHHVQTHAKEKLLLLKDNFIRTQTGKELATKEHNIMIDILNDLESFLVNKNIS